MQAKGSVVTANSRIVPSRLKFATSVHLWKQGRSCLNQFRIRLVDPSSHRANIRIFRQRGLD